MIKRKANKLRNIFVSISIIFLLFLLSHIFSVLLDRGSYKQDLEACVIDIKGTISFYSSAFSNSINPYDVVELIDKCNNRYDLVILEINSPGGSGVAADIIVSKLKSINKPVFAVIDDIGTSAAYLIASSADKIFANKFSLVGSIGATMSYIEISGLMKKYGITYERIVSGKYKDIGTPFRKLTDEEKQMLNKTVLIAAEQFIKEIALNRNLSYEYISNLSNGMIFTGIQAKELKLIDEIGNIFTLKKYLEEKYNKSVKLVRLKKKKGLFDIIEQISLGVGTGLAKGLIYKINEQNLMLR